MLYNCIANPRVIEMIKRSVAPNTLKAYLRVKAEVIWAHFLSDDRDVRIYADRNDLFMWKLDKFHKEEALCLFICYMSNTLKKSRCAIGAVMSALRFLFNACLQDISIFECAGLTASRKSLVERGRNAKSKSTSTPTNFITSDMLAWMRHVVDSSLPLCLKQLMICIAIHLGFHFGYRVGEICVSNGDDSHTIWNEDIIFETTKGVFINAVDAWQYNVSIIDVCLVILRSSKANQTGGGDSQILSRYSTGSIKLLEDLFAWAQTQSKNPKEMFFFRATPGASKTDVGYHLRSCEVTAMIKAAAVHFKMSTDGFSGRSMRVSAATNMNAEHLPLQDRMAVTRHKSASSHQKYVRSTMQSRGALDLISTTLLTVTDIKRAIATKPIRKGKK